MSPTWVNASVSTEVSPFRSSPKLEQQEKQEKFDDDLKEIFMLGSRTGKKKKESDLRDSELKKCQKYPNNAYMVKRFH